MYLTLGSINQVEPEIKIINNTSQSKNVTSNYIPRGRVQTKCDNCNGEGVIECTACKGSGEKVESIDCKKCEGSGKIYKNHNITNCTDCNNGRIVESTVCSICDGHGYVKCHVCRRD